MKKTYMDAQTEIRGMFRDWKGYTRETVERIPEELRDQIFPVGFVGPFDFDPSAVMEDQVWAPVNANRTDEAGVFDEVDNKVWSRWM